MNSLLSVKILGVTTTKTKKAYTMYEMEVSGSILEPYVLFKRYSDFHSLHASVLKLVQSDDKLTKLQDKDELIIPELPKKQLNKNSKKVIEDRQHKLQFYLRTLLKSDALCKSSLIMDFLAVPKAWLHMIEPKKAEIKKHNRNEARLARDRRLKEQEDEEMKLALAISASLAEVNLNKRKQNENKPSQMQYGQYQSSQLYQPPSVHVQQSPQQYGYAQPSAPPESPSLPPGWSAFRTADGRIFYQNDTTQESTWDKPALNPNPNINDNAYQNTSNYNNNNNNNVYNAQKKNDDPFGALSQQFTDSNQTSYDQAPQQYQSQSGVQQYQAQQEQYTQRQPQTMPQYEAPSQQQPQAQYQQPQYNTQYQQPQAQTMDTTVTQYTQPQSQQPQYTQYTAQSQPPQQTVDTTATQYTQPQSQYTQYAQYKPQSVQPTYAPEPQTYSQYAPQSQSQQPQNVQPSMWGSNNTTTSSTNDYNNTPTINNMDELVDFVNFNARTN